MLGVLSVSMAGLAAAANPGYHEIARVRVGGEGGWDYLTVDSPNHHLFLSRGTHVMVFDTLKRAVVGDIPDTSGVHGIAIDDAIGRGFTSNGRDNTVTIFDLKTFATISKVAVGTGPDAICFDPASKRVFTLNGRSRDASAVDAATGTLAGTIPLPGRPEFAIADGHGHVFVNIEDKSEVSEIDSRSLKVLNTWSIAPGDGPSGIAIDPKTGRVFSVCDQMMTVLNAKTGKVIATPKIGEGPDAAGFDPGTKLAFSSNGRSATLTVVHEDSPDSFTVVQDVPTLPGARTMALDPKTHYVYLVTAQFEPRPAGQRGRPAMVPGTFTVLILGPK